MTHVFPYELVKEGKLPFKYEDLKLLLNDKKLILTATLVMFNLIVFQQLTYSVKWLYKSKSTICGSLFTAFRSVIMLTVGYCLLLAQNFIFLRGIDIDPKNLPEFNYELAYTTY